MKNYFALLVCTLACILSVPLVNAQDESVLSNIHKRLMIPGYETRRDHDRILFIGEITALGAVSPSAVCKSAILQSVDYTISDTLLGDPPEQIVRTAYVNCTGESLPSPPYTLHAKVIVYCFRNMSGKSFKGLACLAPVAFTDDRLKKVKSWIADSHAANHNSPS
jgi:hypothetical protein